MSVVIRLSRAGRVHLPYYHIGVYNSRTRRDGRPVEQLGFYDPKSDKEPVRIDVERARYWLSVGARPSVTVATILKGQGVASSEWAKKAATASDKDKKTSARKASAKKKSAKKPAGTAAKKRKPRTASSKARGERTAKA
ncbi:MAG: 30S ribosomal protein S16 [Planctomycetes bacterium]|nr:30S ribosomal protein S16 [Planctomycetota bacterium]MCD7896301.1 30S ribosomal protein S16 [Planctomycetaceae bacterium]